MAPGDGMLSSTLFLSYFYLQGPHVRGEIVGTTVDSGEGEGQGPGGQGGLGGYHGGRFGHTQDKPLLRRLPVPKMRAFPCLPRTLWQLAFDSPASNVMTLKRDASATLSAGVASGRL